MGRDQEAIPVFEKALAQLPSLIADCLSDHSNSTEIARRALQDAQDRLRKYEAGTADPDTERARLQKDYDRLEKSINGRLASITDPGERVRQKEILQRPLDRMRGDIAGAAAREEYGRLEKEKNQKLAEVTDKKERSRVEKKYRPQMEQLQREIAQHRDLPPETKRSLCVSRYGYEAGEYRRAAAAITTNIDTSEQVARTNPSLGSFAMTDRDHYQKRALSLYAIGNSLAAIRDLQTSMALWKKNPDANEFRNYFYRAVILSDAGDAKGAMDDCRIVLTFKEFDPKFRASYAKTYCTNLIAAPQAGEVSTAVLSRAAGSLDSGSSRTSPQPPGGSVSDEIERIRNGEHVPFPPIQAIGGTSSSASPSGIGAFAVKNDTAYTLTVLFSGPTERRAEIRPGASLSIDLLPGSYKVAARVNAPDVSPSYGEHVFDRSSSGVTFYIQ